LATGAMPGTVATSAISAPDTATRPSMRLIVVQLRRKVAYPRLSWFGSLS
jgi:hypothetical protein